MFKRKGQNWLRHQDKEFFAKGIRSLLRRWDKRAEVGGNSVAKYAKKKLYRFDKPYLMHGLFVCLIFEPRKKEFPREITLIKVL